MKAIDLRRTKDRYTDFKFHSSLHGAEIPTLDEILGVESNDTGEPSEPTIVDDEAAKKIEAHALARLNLR